MSELNENNPATSSIRCFILDYNSSDLDQAETPEFTTVLKVVHTLGSCLQSLQTALAPSQHLPIEVAILAPNSEVTIYPWKTLKTTSTT